MATSLKELGIEPVDTLPPAVGATPVPKPDPTGVMQALVGHSLKQMRETNNELRAQNLNGVIAVAGFGGFFLSLLAFTQQTEGEAFLLPWRWALVGTGTLSAWGSFFSGFAVLFAVIYGAGARAGGLVRDFSMAFEQYELECAQGRAKPPRGFRSAGRPGPSAFYGAAYCLLGSGCGGLGLYCWALVLLKAC